MRIGIIGGGLTGLTCAYHIAEKGYNVVLIEKEKEIGGLINSFLIGGNFLEKFYHYIKEDDREILDLIESLSLKSELVWKNSNKGLFYRNNVSCFNNFIDVFNTGSLNFVDRLRLYICMLFLKKIVNYKSLEGITAEKWLRSIGGGSLFRFFWDPILKNSFQDYYSQIGFTYLWAKYRARGNKTGYLRGGFQRLAEVMRQKIFARSGSIRTSTIVKSIIPGIEGGVRIATERDILDVDMVIVTTPVPIFMKMLKNLPVEYAMNLNSIQYMSAVSLVLELSKPFGYIHIMESCDLSFPFVEIVEHTNLVSPEYYEGSSILYIMKYVESDSVYMNYSTHKLLEDYIPYLKRLNSSFEQSCIKKEYLFRADFAYPVMTSNYSRIVPGIETPFKGVFLANTSQAYPELTSINNCIILSYKALDIALSKMVKNT